MDRFNPITDREKNRRSDERRDSTRRIMQHFFASKEWITSVQATYTFWPNEDRRDQERRGLSRQMLERRSLILKARQYSRRQHALQKGSQRQRLTTEEKEMLSKLNHND